MDYKKLGFKCGIEIHQRLSGGKLFCNCPGKLREDEPDIKVRREMRAVAGETGEVDVAAAHEMGKVIAEHGLRLWYGAGSTGLMGELANGALEAGGQVIGVIPQIFNTYLSMSIKYC